MTHWDFIGLAVFGGAVTAVAWVIAALFGASMVEVRHDDNRPWGWMVMLFAVIGLIGLCVLLAAMLGTPKE